MTPKRLFKVPAEVRALDALRSMQVIAHRVGGYYPLEAEHFVPVLALGRDAVAILREAGVEDVPALVDVLDALERDPGGPDTWRPKLDRIAELASELSRRVPTGPTNDGHRGVPMYGLAELVASVMDEAPQPSGLKHLLKRTTQAAEYDWLPGTSTKRGRK